MRTTPSSPVGLHRVLDPTGDALPQTARVLDARVRSCGRTRCSSPSRRSTSMRRSYRQSPTSTPTTEVDGAPRDEVLAIVATRGKMQNPVTGSGGMLIGTVDAVGPRDQPRPGRRRPGRDAGVALADPADHHRRPRPLGRPLRAGARAGHRRALRPLDRGAPARRPLARARPDGHGRLRCTGPRGPRGGGVRRPVGSPRPLPSSAAPASPGRSRSPRPARGRGTCIGVVPVEREADLLRRERPGRRGRRRRRPITVGPVGCRGCRRRPRRRHRRLRRRARLRAAGHPATAQGGTIIYFSMATSFSAAALGAEGLAADVRMLVGNGYVPGHADLALDLLRRTPAVRALFEARLAD